MLAQGEESLALLECLVVADDHRDWFVQSVASELKEQLLAFKIISGNISPQPLDSRIIDWLSMVGSGGRDIWELTATNQIYYNPLKLTKFYCYSNEL